MIPESLWYRPLTVPRIEVLKFQSAEARFGINPGGITPGIGRHSSSSIDRDFLPSDRIDPDLATEKELLGAPRR